MVKIIIACGARPNFIKIAPLVHAFKARQGYDLLLVHTGQHYDENMSKLFFDELNIPKPDINLEVGSGSHAVQTAKIMKRFEPVFQDYRPDYVLVVGDVNSTIACGLVTVKMGARLIHVEAGLRSFDRGMPEEINRVLTDAISDILFVTEQSGLDNLAREGINAGKVHLVGNVMIDTLVANRDKAQKSKILQILNLVNQDYVVVTLHRPSNVDHKKTLDEILNAFAEIQKNLKIIFPIHPRAKKNMVELGMGEKIKKMKNLLLVDPLGYLDFLCLMSNAKAVITDSGGIQEETTILGIPCMTLRENTERPVTITEGTNRLVPITSAGIISHYQEIKNNSIDNARIPEFWDGKAAERIVDIISAIDKENANINHSEF